jgi:hypothetical protein
VTSLVFTVGDNDNNPKADGWGIDDASVVAQIPVSAAGWLRRAGISALFGFGRRKATA